MNAATRNGIALGLLVGGSAGVLIERTTRVDPGPSDAEVDRWTDDALAAFEDERVADGVRRENLDSEIRRYVRDNPPPPGVEVSRTGGAWTASGPEERDRGSLLLAVSLGSVFGTLIGGSIAASKRSPHPDMAAIMGRSGMLRLALPVATASLGAAMLVSSFIGRGGDG